MQVNSMSNFNQKIIEQFTSFEVKRPNESKSKIQIFADFIELICMFSKDYVSKSDIIDRLIDSGEDFSVSLPVDGETGLIDSQKHDKAEGWADSIFEYIEERKTIYKSYYPFEIEREIGIKLIEPSTLTEVQKLYLYLLIASSLNSFKKLQHEITKEFESLSEIVLKSYLPENSKVYGFGSNTKYTGNAQSKIIQLSKDINVDIDMRIISQIPTQSSKEEGLDIISWLPFEDNNPNTIIIFGQCACGKDWFGKQIDTYRYNRFYKHYLQPFTHAMFFPHDFRNKDGRFGFDIDLFDNNLVFERRRFLNLANEDIFEHLNYSKQIIDKCLEYSEDLV